MSSDISWRDQYVCVSNRQLFDLVELALQVGNDCATSSTEREFVDRLRHWLNDESWPGIGFDLDEHFPTLDEKKFWSRCFYDLSRRIFRREIGENANGNTVWQPSMIGDAYIVARLLTRAVQESELAWHPETEQSKEASEIFAKIRTTF